MVAGSQHLSPDMYGALLRFNMPETPPKLGMFQVGAFRLCNGWHGVQWLRRNKGKSEKHPLDGSVVQRLQRFATYGSLKQQVLRIITDELAISHEKGQDALKKVRIFWGRPWHPGVLQVLGQSLHGWAALASWHSVVFYVFACFCMFVHWEHVHSHINMNQAPDVVCARVLGCRFE
jgi:hypothetical protein